MNDFYDEEVVEVERLTPKLRRLHSTDELCACVSRHVPMPHEYIRHHVVPMYLGGADDESNIVLICPTTHYNVHRLIRELDRAHRTGVLLPWSEWRLYSPFTRSLARRGWEGRTK